MDTAQMKQAMEMVNNMKRIQKELEKTDIEVESSKGEVKIVITGAQELKSVKIDPACVNLDKINDLEKVILKTINNALEKSQKLQKEKMKPLTGGINIPGLF